MKNTIKIVILLALFSSFAYANDAKTFSLTVKVEGLRNSEGIVQFALYNEDGSIPDEEYKKYHKKQTAKIDSGSSCTVFEDLPEGKYAVNVLHDENIDGKMNKGFILPTEGIGFTNYTSIKLTNRPNFLKASFNLTSNKTKVVKIIYF